MRFASGSFTSSHDDFAASVQAPTLYIRIVPGETYPWPNLSKDIYVTLHPVYDFVVLIVGTSSKVWYGGGDGIVHSNVNVSGTEYQTFSLTGVGSCDKAS